jgi:hypothetical protein
MAKFDSCYSGLLWDDARSLTGNIASEPGDAAQASWLILFTCKNMNTFDTEPVNMKIRTKRSGLLLSFFVLLILKVTFTQIILARGKATSLSVSKSESVNPIEKEIEAMDAINKKLAALSFGSPTINGKIAL